MEKIVAHELKEMTLEDSLRAAPTGTARLLEQSLAGLELDFDDALLLAQADGAELQALVKTADEMRRRAVGDAVTYVVNRNVNFTNVCIVGCAFCGFARGPHATDSYSLSIEQVVAKAVEARALGATEVCIQGGLAREMDGYFYRDILRGIKGALPDMHIHAFSPMEIAYGVEKTGLAPRDYLQMLKDEGLGSIPGTAAEILDDEIRASLSPNKLAARQWVEIVKTAHRLGIPSTSTMMYGHTERPEHWIRHILLLREIQKETGGFTEFVPLAFIHEKTRLYRRGDARAGSTLREDLIVHALARLLLNGWIKHVQVSWVKLGFEVSLACLEAGADDFGGTLMEESISKSAGATFGESVTPEEFRRLIRRIGRPAAERTTTYKTRRVFPDAPEGAEETAAQPDFARAHTPALAVMDAPRHYTGTGY